MADVWLKALFATPPCIYGRQLLPFSLSHSLMLDGLASPYWRGGNATADDLCAAIDVCSRNWRENAVWLAHSDNPRVRRSLSALKTAARLLGHEKADAAFRAYINDHMDFPPREVRGPGRQMASPWQWRVASWLLRGGMSEDEIWNMPCARAVAYLDASNESEGDDSLVDEADASVADMIARANALAKTDPDAATKLWADATAILESRNAAAAKLRRLIS